MICGHLSPFLTTLVDPPSLASSGPAPGRSATAGSPPHLSAAGGSRAVGPRFSGHKTRGREPPCPRSLGATASPVGLASFAPDRLTPPPSSEPGSAHLDRLRPALLRFDTRPPRHRRLDGTGRGSDCFIWRAEPPEVATPLRQQEPPGPLLKWQPALYRQRRPLAKDAAARPEMHLRGTAHLSFFPVIEHHQPYNAAIQRLMMARPQRNEVDVAYTCLIIHHFHQHCHPQFQTTLLAAPPRQKRSLGSPLQ